MKLLPLLVLNLIRNKVRDAAGRLYRTNHSIVLDVRGMLVCCRSSPEGSDFPEVHTCREFLSFSPHAVIETDVTAIGVRTTTSLVFGAAGCYVCIPAGKRSPQSHDKNQPCRMCVVGDTGRSWSMCTPHVALATACCIHFYLYECFSSAKS